MTRESIARWSVNVRIRAACCIILFLIAGAFFVLDVLNPNTPQPDVLERALAFAVALLLVVKACAGRPLIAERTRPHTSVFRCMRDLPELGSDRADFLCSRLI